jgi:uncharacterized protein (TIGR01777 family)
MKLLLIGCTGFIGRELVPLLKAAGHQLTIVSRKAKGDGYVQADPAVAENWQPGAPLANALNGAEGVVNLAGEPIAEQRWTPAHRQLLRDSRINTTKLLAAAISAAKTPPQVLLSGSAVGFYGNSSQTSFTETSPNADDFLGRLCREWEQAAAEIPDSCRLVVVRTGIVLAADGGALGKMLPIFRAGFGGPIGTGRQWMSWIERSDFCALIATALIDPTYLGAYNGTAPNPVMMAQFCQSLGKTLGRPSLLPVPGPLLQLLLGDGASVVLEGQKVLPEHLQQQGFEFKYADLNQALAAATSSMLR